MRSKNKVFVLLNFAGPFAVLLGLVACSKAQFGGGSGQPKPAEAQDAQPVAAAPAPTPAPTAVPTPGIVSSDTNSTLAQLNLPKFGLMVNDLECGLCHVSVRGSVQSTRDVPPLWSGSDAIISGTWKVNGAFKGSSIVPGSGTQGNSIIAKGGVEPNSTDASLVKKFPVLDFAKVESLVSGQVTTSSPQAQTVSKVYNGNLVLRGTAADPIVISKDILVKGDLVIVGTYKGIGTIYVTGNIYIPFDLTASNSVFPFPDSDTDALAAAQQDVKDSSKDALGLVSKANILMADLEIDSAQDGGHNGQTIYDHPATPANRNYSALNVRNVYSWFPGGQTGYAALYGNATVCVAGRSNSSKAGFNLVDAFLYAQNTIAGVARAASFSIRGGVIADYYHVIAGAASCDGTNSPKHGHPNNRSYIEYDYRLQTGLLPILERVGEALSGS